MDIPKHVAIIPDGNRRWARKQGLPTVGGHKKGAEMVLKLVKKAKELDIKILTFWAFSTENWGRTQKESKYLMSLFERGIDRNFKDILKNHIHFSHIGRKDRLSKSLAKKITQLADKTRDFSEHYFVLALDYGGRDEILRAIAQISNFQFPNLRLHSGQVSKLTEENFNQFLDTKDLPYPYPDLVIRTGGEERTSSFMIWQSAYSEWIFYPKYFPDFTTKDFEECINEYTRRQRRFGR